MNYEIFYSVLEYLIYVIFRSVELSNDGSVEFFCFIIRKIKWVVLYIELLWFIISLYSIIISFLFFGFEMLIFFCKYLTRELKNIVFYSSLFSY